MPIKNISTQLKEEGWSIKEEFIQNLEDQSLKYQDVLKLLLSTDFKVCGCSSLSGDILKGKAPIKTPLVLQVTNVNNVSSPKSNQESGAAPRMLKLTLTDGVNFINGLEVSYIDTLSLKTAPGTKVKLISDIISSGSILLLKPSNIQLLGGVVEDLYKKWKISESVSKYMRSNVTAYDSSGPPQWIPFGNKITIEKEEDFKALGEGNVKKKDEEFEQQRQQAVLELSKESSQKVFGGGKQMLDSNVQKIINSGGFTIEEAAEALKRNKNDVHKAIQDLKRSQEFATLGYSRMHPPVEEGGRENRRGRGRGARGKDVKGPDGSDEDIPTTSVFRPSGPASLLDYLENRIQEKSGDNETPSYHPSEERFAGRGRSGRGGRGRRPYPNKAASIKQNDLSVFNESWPTLGEETSIQDLKKEAKRENYDEKFSNQQERGGVSNSVQDNRNDSYQPYYQNAPRHSQYGKEGYQHNRNYSSNNFDNNRQSSNYNQYQKSYNRSDGRVNEGYNRSDGRSNESYNRSDGRSNESYNRSDGRVNEGYNRLDGRGNESYNRSDGRVNEGYNRSDGRSNESYNRSDGRSNESYNKSDGRANEGYNRSDGRSNESYNRSDGRFNEGYNRSDGRSNESYNRSDGRFNEGYNRSDGRINGGYNRSDGRFNEGYNRSNGRGNEVFTRSDGRVNEGYNRPDYRGNEGYQSEYQGRRPEQQYYRRGHGGDFPPRGRGNYGQYRNQYYATNSTDGYNSHEAESPRTHSTKERDLIAQFERSMIAAGVYEERHYGYQNQQQPMGNDYQYYSDNGAGKKFSGTYEYHRGGEGSARRSRGRGPRRY